MKNYALNSDFKYPEIAIALEDYSFGSIVKFTIPTLFTFLNKNSPISETKLNSKSNVVNKNPIDIGEYNICNYIELYVGTEKSAGRTSGLKGDKYVVVFPGGDINNCTIIEAM